MGSFDGKVIDFTSGKMKVIDLTTPEKAKAHFDKVNEPEKPTMKKLRSLTNEELDKMYDDLEAREQAEFRRDMADAYRISDKSEQHSIRSKQYKHYFESSRFNYYQDKAKASKTKKANYHFIDNLAINVSNNATFQMFKDNFDSGLRTTLKPLELRVDNFTEKELKRLYDFSLNKSKKSFGK